MLNAARPARSSRTGLILLAFIAFISLGLPDGLLGVAWPSMRRAFGLELDAIGFLLLLSVCGYLASSFFSGQIVNRLGVGRLLAASCLLTGGALLGYSVAPTYWVIVGLSLFAGIGAGAIDAGLNTYIAANHGEGLMQWLHASFGLGVTLGPIIMTAAVNNFGVWQLGYAVVGVAQVVLAISFALTAAMWKRTEPDETASAVRMTDYRTPMADTLRQPRVWLSALLFFTYTGVELALGHWAYTLLTESRGIPPETAGITAGAYWGMFTVGRILAGLYAGRLRAQRILWLAMSGALVGAVLVTINLSGATTLAGIVLIGFSVAPVYPALVSTTTLRVGARHAANTIGMQVSAAGFGATIAPTIAGFFARRTSLEVIPVLLVVFVLSLMTLFAVASRRPAADATVTHAREIQKRPG